jgi:hypothetical protein
MANTEMKNYEKLASHIFMKKNFEYIKPVLDNSIPAERKHLNQTGKFRSNQKKPLNISDYYHVMVFKKASAIISEIERLEESLVYMQKFPNPRTYEKRGVHQFSWLEYHYSYFVITYHSLFDTGLILTNTVFQLGIPEKDCKSTIVIGNEWVKGTTAKTTLIALEKLISNYGKTRNLFLHRGAIPDVKSVTNSDLLDLLKVISTVNQHSKPIAPVDLVDNVFKNESKKIIIKLNSDVINAQRSIAKLFDALLPIYKSKAEEYKNL